MSLAAPLQAASAKPQAALASAARGVLQRKCACGTSKSSSEGRDDEFPSPLVQRKLAIGATSDPLEREADRVADQVLAAPSHAAVGGAPPQIQRYTVQATGEAPTAPASVDHALADSGRPLEPALRQDMEQRFAHDFSQVRIHTDAQAAQSARNVSARAYTVGQHVVFGAGEFAPDTRRGRQLLGHELAHTVQQGGTLARVPLIAHLAPGSPLESAAAAAGRAVVNGGAVTQPLGRSGIVLARELIGNENQWVPQALRDQEKIKQFWQLWARYRKRDIQPWEYPQ
ncbi:MAG TPA: DUF4157 domain-containing protein, partial [Azonexus sp.]|nr:DUF4157 domain-containing protein [Azonexus sp.]